MDFDLFVASQPNILVVDDLSSARKIMARFLQKLGFTNIDEAVDGADAIEKLRLKEFRVVISDWEMPKLSGLDLYKSIKGSKICPDAFIMVSSHSAKAQVLEAVEAGVSDYVLKPFDEKILKAKLLKAFECIEESLVQAPAS